MACTRCTRRSKLMTRTFRRLLSRNADGSTNKVTVKNRECKIAKSITPEGYVANCLKCGAKGEPSPIPETATLECKEGEEENVPSK